LHSGRPVREECIIDFIEKSAAVQEDGYKEKGKDG
ncbi:MAG: hypothetical protein RLZZ05_904, partial [Bacteroidota bacterium]